MSPEVVSRIQKNWDSVPASVQERLLRAGFQPGGGATTPTTTQPESSTTTTPTVGNEQKPAPSGTGGDIARVGAALAGGAMGGPIGAMGATALTDLAIQGSDVAAGAQDEINPGQTIVEAGTAALPAMGKGPITAAITAGAGGAIGNIGRRLVAGEPVQLDGELVLTTGAAALLGGVARKFENRLMFGKAAQELTGDNEVVQSVDNLLTKPQVEYTAAETKKIADRLGIRVESIGKPGALSFEDPVAQVKQELTLGKVAKKFPTPEGPGKLTKSGRLVKPEFSGSGKPSFTVSYLGSFMPEETAMDVLQKQTGYPVYSDYRTLNDRFEVHKSAINAFSDKLQTIFRGTSAATRASWASALDSGATDAAATLKLSSRDARHVNQLMSVVGDIEEKFGTSYADHIARSGMKDLPDALPRVTSFLRKSSFDYHLGEDWGNAFKKYQSAKDPVVKAQMMRVLNAMRGNPDTMSIKLTATLNRVLGKMGIEGVDARSLANQLTSINYSGALGGRMGPVIKNSIQPIQTAYPYLGERWTAHGLISAMSPSKRAEAIASGVTRGQALDLADVESIASGPVKRGLNFAISKSLAPFAKVEEWVRSWTYLAGRDKALWAAKKANGNLAKFIDLADVDRFQSGAQSRIIGAFTEGGAEKAADEMGKHLVTLTQFDYSAAARPKALTEYGPAGLAGRVAGSFGTWSASYGSYLADSFGPGRAQGSKIKIGRDLVRWTIANAAIAKTYQEIGHALHDEDAGSQALGWTFVAPLFFGGGPAATAFLAAGELLSKASQGKNAPQAKAELKRTAKTFIPGAVAAGEFRQALEEPTMAEGIGRITGFKRGK